MRCTYGDAPDRKQWGGHASIQTMTQKSLLLSPGTVLNDGKSRVDGLASEISKIKDFPHWQVD